MTAFNSILELDYKIQPFGISFTFNIIILKNITTKIKLLFPIHSKTPLDQILSYYF